MSNAFSLKSQMVPISVIEFNEESLSEFDQQLAQKVAASPALFRYMPVILAVDSITEASESQIQQLLFTVRKHSILPIALRGSDDVKALAAKLDLAWVPPGRNTLKKQAQALQKAEQLKEEQIKEEQQQESQNSDAETSSEEKAAIEVTAEPATSNEQLELTAEASSQSTDTDDANTNDHSSDKLPAQPLPAKVITTPVRSGQQVYAKGTDLVVLTQVGEGAEVIADGNIHIYGTLRGRAIAGASGNEHARIFCQSLKAELISIAGTYQVSDDLPAEQNGASCHVELKENHLHITSL